MKVTRASYSYTRCRPSKTACPWTKKGEDVFMAVKGRGLRSFRSSDGCTVDTSPLPSRDRDNRRSAALRSNMTLWNTSGKTAVSVAQLNKTLLLLIPIGLHDHGEQIGISM